MVESQCAHISDVLLWHRQEMIVRGRFNVLKNNNLLADELKLSVWTVSSNYITKYTRFSHSHSDFIPESTGQAVVFIYIRSNLKARRVSVRALECRCVR